MLMVVTSENLCGSETLPETSNRRVRGLFSMAKSEPESTRKIERAVE